MKLEDAVKFADHLPPADQRRQMIEDQLGNLRREFYGHVLNLHRLEALAEDKRDDTYDELVQASEAALDHIAGHIAATSSALKAL